MILEAEAFSGQPQNCMWDEMPATLKIACDEQEPPDCEWLPGDYGVVIIRYLVPHGFW